MVAYHLGHLSGGFLGVDVFFVLSGYLVTALALREVDRDGSLALRAFWGRRVRRLGPALFVMVPVVLAAAVLLRWDRTTFDIVAWDATATLTWWANWRQAFGDVGGYWASSPSLFRHAWSLAIEEQFYATWPLVFTGAVALATRRGRSGARGVAVVGSIIAALSAIWGVVLAHRLDVADLSRVYVGTDTRIAGPLLGCILAAVLHERPLPTAGRALTVVRAAAGLAAVGLAVLIVGVDVASPTLYRTGLLFGASVLATVALAGARTLTRGEPVTGWLGRRSYAIYLWSWPLQVLVQHRWPDMGRWTVTALVVPVSLVLAEVSWHLIEHPAQRRRLWAARPVPRRLVGSGLVAAGVVSVLVIVALAAPVPAHRRFGTEDSVDEAVRHAPPPPLSGDRDDPDRPERVMLLGDSVAWTIGYYAPVEDLPEGIATVDSRAAIGCGLLAHEGYEWRTETGDWATPGDRACVEVARGIEIGFTGEPDVVVVMPGAWEWSEVRDPDGEVLAARSPELEAVLRRRLLELARSADEVGARTLLVDWSCPGPDTEAERTGSYIPWINGLLDRTAEIGRDDGLEIAIGRPPATVCVDGDPAGAATPEKNHAMQDEVHVQDFDGGRWAWDEWIAPMIRETRPVPKEQVMILGDSTAFAVGTYVPEDLPEGIASVDNRAANGCSLIAPLGYGYLQLPRGEPYPIGAEPFIPVPKCARMDEAIDTGLEGEPDVVVVEFGAWESGPVQTPDGRVVPARSEEMAAIITERLDELVTRIDDAGARVVLAPLACPGPAGTFSYLRTPGYIEWLGSISSTVIEASTAAGRDVTQMPTPETACVGGDRAGDATPEKNRAMDDEVHLADEDGGAWLWDTWWGPGIVETRGTAEVEG